MNSVMCSQVLDASVALSNLKRTQASATKTYNIGTTKTI